MQSLQKGVVYFLFLFLTGVEYNQLKWSPGNSVFRLKIQKEFDIGLGCVCVCVWEGSSEFRFLPFLTRNYATLWTTKFVIFPQRLEDSPKCQYAACFDISSNPRVYQNQSTGQFIKHCHYSPVTHQGWINKMLSENNKNGPKISLTATHTNFHCES